MKVLAQFLWAKNQVSLLLTEFLVSPKFQTLTLLICFIVPSRKQEWKKKMWFFLRNSRRTGRTTLWGARETLCFVVHFWKSEKIFLCHGLWTPAYPLTGKEKMLNKFWFVLRGDCLKVLITRAANWTALHTSAVPPN